MRQFFESFHRSKLPKARPAKIGAKNNSGGHKQQNLGRRVDQAKPPFVRDSASRAPATSTTAATNGGATAIARQ
jgi:hypothetical protein